MERPVWRIVARVGCQRPESRPGLEFSRARPVRGLNPG